MKNLTRVAGSLFARLLAEDVATTEPSESATAMQWRSAAEKVLLQLDDLDDHDDPELAAGNVTMLLDGELWLQLAEEGGLAEDFVAHVLNYASDGRWGYAGPPFVRSLLQAIDRADQENRDAMALAFPEYVGLWSAVLNVRGGQDRLWHALLPTAKKSL